MRNARQEDIDLTGQENGVEAASFWRFGASGWQLLDASVVRETPINVIINGREYVTILCTPLRLNHLVLGFLANEGLIDGLGDVSLMRVCDEESNVDVRLVRDLPQASSPRTLTSGCGGSFTVDQQAQDLPAVTQDLSLEPQQVLALVKELQVAATLFRYCGGVHTSGLADKEHLLMTAEDVGRHNTVDKIRGQCLFEGRDSSGLVLLTTGRLSSEIVVKAAKMATPIVVSRNSPTSRAIALATAVGITLIGYARAGGVTVYTHPHRLGIRGKGAS